MKWWLAVGLGALLVALGTWYLGWTVPIWWGLVVPFIGFVRRPVSVAAISAALGWGAILLGYLVIGDPVAVLASRLAGAMQQATWVLVVATVIYPALLSGCSAWLVSALRPRRHSRNPG